MILHVVSGFRGSGGSPTAPADSVAMACRKLYHAASRGACCARFDGDCLRGDRHGHCRDTCHRGCSVTSRGIAVDSLGKFHSRCRGHIHSACRWQEPWATTKPVGLAVASCGLPRPAAYTCPWQARKKTKRIVYTEGRRDSGEILIGAAGLEKGCLAWCQHAIAGMLSLGKCTTRV